MSGDQPDSTRIITSGISDVDTVVSIPAGHVSVKFPRIGATVEFDDDSNERALVDAIDPSLDQITLVRGQDGTIAQSHAVGTRILIDPRFSREAVEDAINHIIDVEFWPAIWHPGEGTLTYQSTNEYYDPGVSDIEDVVWAYQLSSGVIVPCRVTFMSPTLADDANFPQGTIIIPWTYDTSTIYFGYRSRITVSNLSASQEHLVTLGATGHLLMLEETLHVAPSASMLERRVNDGSKLRAGATLWQRFEEAKVREQVNLISEEGIRVRTVRRS